MAFTSYGSSLMNPHVLDSWRTAVDDLCLNGSLCETRFLFSWKGHRFLETNCPPSCRDALQCRTREVAPNAARLCKITNRVGRGSWRKFSMRMKGLESSLFMNLRPLSWLAIGLLKGQYHLVEPEETLGRSSLMGRAVQGLNGADSKRAGLSFIVAVLFVNYWQFPATVYDTSFIHPVPNHRHSSHSCS